MVLSRQNGTTEEVRGVVPMDCDSGERLQSAAMGSKQGNGEDAPNRDQSSRHDDFDSP